MGFLFSKRSRAGVMVITALMSGVLAAGCVREPDPSSPEGARLEIIDHAVGDGEEAVSGRTVEVHYTGWLWVDGERSSEFDSSVARGPFQFPLGAGRVIRGWDEGVEGMKVGGRRELIIPPDMGYGAGGVPGVIPPNSTLNFEVELLRVLP